MPNNKIITEYVSAALALHELHLDEVRQAAVIDQFQLLAEMAQTFMNQVSPDEEPAPVYRL